MGSAQCLHPKVREEKTIEELDEEFTLEKNARRSYDNRERRHYRPDSEDFDSISSFSRSLRSEHLYGPKSSHREAPGVGLGRQPRGRDYQSTLSDRSSDVGGSTDFSASVDARRYQRPRGAGVGGSTSSAMSASSFSGLSSEMDDMSMLSGRSGRSSSRYSVDDDLTVEEKVASVRRRAEMEWHDGEHEKSAFLKQVKAEVNRGKTWRQGGGPWGGDHSNYGASEPDRLSDYSRSGAWSDRISRSEPGVDDERHGRRRRGDRDRDRDSDRRSDRDRHRDRRDRDYGGSDRDFYDDYEDSYLSDRRRHRRTSSVSSAESGDDDYYDQDHDLRGRDRRERTRRSDGRTTPRSDLSRGSRASRDRGNGMRRLLDASTSPDRDPPPAPPRGSREYLSLEDLQGDRRREGRRGSSRGGSGRGSNAGNDPNALALATSMDLEAKLDVAKRNHAEVARRLEEEKERATIAERKLKEAQDDAPGGSDFQAQLMQNVLTLRSRCTELDREVKREQRECDSIREQLQQDRKDLEESQRKVGDLESLKITLEQRVRDAEKEQEKAKKKAEERDEEIQQLNKGLEMVKFEADEAIQLAERAVKLKEKEKKNKQLKEQEIEHMLKQKNSEQESFRNVFGGVDQLLTKLRQGEMSANGEAVRELVNVRNEMRKLIKRSNASSTDLQTIQEGPEHQA